ncbi:MAG: hypothetical protein SGARI_006014 [Bacillariaceae sp.]
MSDTSSIPESSGPPRGLLFSHFLCGVLTTIIVQSFGDFENSTEALAFYGVYHRYGWNQFIHFFGVPGILWSLMIFMMHVKLPGSIMGHEINYGNALAVIYGLYYLKIDPIGGLLYAPLLVGFYWSAYKLYLLDQKVAAVEVGEENVPWYGSGKILKFAAVAHFLSWYVQIAIGHYMIEGAQPASKENLGAALTVAPLFAFYEGLWLLGVNTALQESTKILGIFP